MEIQTFKKLTSDKEKDKDNGIDMENCRHELLIETVLEM